MSEHSSAQITEMSKQATDIVRFILRQLSGCKYGYVSVVSGCYDAAINNYGLPVPSESKDYVVNEALSALST